MKTRLCATPILAALLSACASAGGAGVKLPPIVISMPTASIPPTGGAVDPPKAKPRATLAFEVVDEDTGAAIGTAFVTIGEPGKLIDQSAVTGNTGDKPIAVKQVNSAGYVAFELVAGGGIYAVMVEAPDYATRVRRFMLGESPNESDGAGNRQFTIDLKSTKPKPVTNPPPAPPTPAPPTTQPQPPGGPVNPPAPPADCDRESDPQSCVRLAAGRHPQLLQTNTEDSCVEFTQRVLALLGPTWGHVGKPAGQAQAVPHGFTEVVIAGVRITGVSHDAIKHRTTGQVVDILGNALASTPAIPTWNQVPSREGNPFVPAVPVR